MAEPKTIRAGDSAAWTASYGDYPAQGGWALDYVITTKDGGISGIAGVPNGDDFDISLDPATTKKLASGEYHLVGRMSRGLEKVTVYDESLRVEPNLFDQGPGADSRTQAARGLEAINAVLEGRASKDQENYSINGRSLSRTSIPDLIILQRFYRAELAREERAARIARGLGAGNIIRVRF